MTPFRAIALLSAAAFGMSLASAAAQDKTSASSSPSPLVEKLNAYVGCINRLSERSYESRNRYSSWAIEDRADRQGADHLRDLHHLRHDRLQEERREGQRGGAAPAAEEASGKDGDAKLGSFFVSSAKS